MARLIFTNKSNTVIVVAVGDESYSLFPSQIQCVPVPDGTAQFSVCTGGRSYINYFIKSAGIISKRHFTKMLTIVKKQKNIYKHLLHNLKTYLDILVLEQYYVIEQIT